MVFALGGSKLANGLAPPFPDHAAAESWYWPDFRAARAAANELFRNRTMDALPSIRPSCTSDHDKFWFNDGLPAIEESLGPVVATVR